MENRIIGFEELGNVDSFSTATLELRLLHTGLALSPSKYKYDSNMRRKVLFKKIPSCLLSTMHVPW